MASSPAPGLPKQVSDGMPSMSPAQPADATSPEPRAVPSRGVFGIFGGFGTSAAQSAPPGFSTGGPQMQSNMIMQTQTADLSAVSSAAPSASSHTLLSSSIGIEGPPLPFPSFTASSAEAPAAAAASEPSVSKGEGVRTVDIVSASDEKALESSIGAVIHSVLDDYKTVSVPKAAVGFALIRPRREFDMPERQPG
ncbi:hypothetical protein GGI12_004051 [Dipsacomyces acuminosporus]|nr:hypothetical protein GGI12_004051 [Dipsacomyces acuminosporus]